MTLAQFLEETYPWWAIAAGMLSGMLALAIGVLLAKLRGRL